MGRFKEAVCLPPVESHPSKSGQNQTGRGLALQRRPLRDSTRIAGNDKESTPSRLTSPLAWHGMNGMRRRLLCFFVALAVPVFLAGCGSANSSLNPQTSTSSPSIAGTNGDAGTSGSSGSSGGTSSSGSGGSGSGSSGSGSSGSGSSGSGSGSGSGGSGSSGTVISNIQTLPNNWTSYGQVGPSYKDCSPSPCEGISWSMKPGITLPSLSNNATQFNLGGTAPYGDVLFETGLIGQNSKQIPDRDHSLLPTLHNFTYDADFYVTNPSITQALEFDISIWMSNIAGDSFGTHCDHLGDGTWKVWNNSTKHWVSTGKPCQFVQGWNHLTLQFERQSDNSTLYQSITLNGTTYSLNLSYPPAVAPAGWWGMETSFQMDGNSQPSANTAYLDNVTVTYE